MLPSYLIEAGQLFYAHGKLFAIFEGLGSLPLGTQRVGGPAPTRDETIPVVTKDRLVVCRQSLAHSPILNST